MKNHFFYPLIKLHYVLCHIIFFIFTMIILPISANGYFYNRRIHKEQVHQYIVQEAYRFLEKEVGEIPVMKDYIGLNNFGPGRHDNHWYEQAAISTGVWQEDLFDSIWEYHGIAGACISSTHFWNADKGDDAQSEIFGCGNKPNAYQKALLYIFGSDKNSNFTFTRDMDTHNWSPTFGGYYFTNLTRFRYKNLCDFYQTGNLRFVNWTVLNGETNYENKDMQFSEETRKLFAFNILGRICHLLGDMSVPAHVKEDIHPCKLGDEDYYELYMGGNATGDCNQHHQSFYAQNWDYQSIRMQGGLLYEVFDMQEEEAIRYLFYTLNQLTDHFKSDDEPANQNLPNGTNLTISSRYYELGAPEQVYVAPDAIANETLKYCIRATATLLYWFAAKAGLISCPNNIFLQSEKFYGSLSNTTKSSIRAQQLISIGKNVKSDRPSGDYIIEPSAKLDIIAGSEIHIQSGAHLKQGSHVHAFIESCQTLGNSGCQNNQSNYDNAKFNKGTTHTILNDNNGIIDTVSRLDLYLYNNWSRKNFNDDSVSYTQVFKYIPIYDDYTRNIDTLQELFLPHTWICDTIRVFNENDSLTTTFTERSSIRMDVDSTVITFLNQSNINNSNSSNFIIKIVYPNPTNSLAVISTNEILNGTLTIYNQMGGIVEEVTLLNNDTMVTVDVSNTPPGIYSIVIKSEKGTTSKNFVIQR